MKEDKPPRWRLIRSISRIPGQEEVREPSLSDDNSTFIKDFKKDILNYFKKGEHLMKNARRVLK